MPFENAERFTKLMLEAGNTCTLIPYEGEEHGFFNGAFFRPNNGNQHFTSTMQQSMEFLEKLGFCRQKRSVNK